LTKAHNRIYENCYSLTAKMSANICRRPKHCLGENTASELRTGCDNLIDTQPPAPRKVVIKRL
ncbi:MAG: hypothetical protein WBP88_15250, partial [Nitrososphaeraceae archaeon]